MMYSFSLILHCVVSLMIDSRQFLLDEPQQQDIFSLKVQIEPIGVLWYLNLAAVTMLTDDFLPPLRRAPQTAYMNQPTAKH